MKDQKYDNTLFKGCNHQCNPSLPSRHWPCYHSTQQNEDQFEGLPHSLQCTYQNHATEGHERNQPMRCMHRDMSSVVLHQVNDSRNIKPPGNRWHPTEEDYQFAEGFFRKQNSYVLKPAYSFQICISDEQGI